MGMWEGWMTQKPPLDSSLSAERGMKNVVGGQGRGACCRQCKRRAVPCAEEGGQEGVRLSSPVQKSRRGGWSSPCKRWVKGALIPMQKVEFPLAVQKVGCWRCNGVVPCVEGHGGVGGGVVVLHAKATRGHHLCKMWVKGALCYVQKVGLSWWHNMGGGPLCRRRRTRRGE